MKKLKSVNTAELILECMKSRKRLERQVKLAFGKRIVFNVDYEYAVDLDRIKTKDDLIDWILHMNEKTWVSQDHLDRFIRLVLVAKKWSVNKSAKDYEL